MKTCPALRRGEFRNSLARALLALIALASISLRADAADATVSPTSLGTDSSGVVSVTITGLSTAGTAERVLVQRFSDANGNGAVDAGEFLVEASYVTDGGAPKIGGVRNVNVPGDEDGAFDGQILYKFRPHLSAELGRLAGSYLIQVSSAHQTPTFQPVLRTFALTQPTLPQSISGTVRAGETPVANAGVVLLQLIGEDNEFYGGAVTDASGQFTIKAPSGNYMVLAAKSGYVASFAEAAQVSLPANGTATANPNLIPATTSVSGKISRQGQPEPNGLPGVQLFVQSAIGGVVLASTAADGTFSVPVTADQWALGISEASALRLGLLRPDSDALATADTRTGAATNINFSLVPASALIFGTISDSNGDPIAGVMLGASNNSNISSEAMSLEDGRYALGVAAGDWNFWFSNDNNVLSNYVAPSGTNLTLTTGVAVTRNYTLAPVTARIQGFVRQNGSPVPNFRVGAYNQATNSYVQMATATDGTFDLGAAAGTWTVNLDQFSAAEAGLIGPSINVTLVDGQTASGLTVDVLTANRQIQGSVLDTAQQPVSGGNVYAWATINSLSYRTNTQIQNGAYTLFVSDGVWSVGANPNGFPNIPTSDVNVSGSNVTKNFEASNLPSIQNQPSPQTVQENSSFGFSVSASSLLQLSYRWQISTDSGANWTDLADNSTYSNTSTASMSGTAVISMSGYRYRCVVSNTAGSTPSNAAALTVNATNVAPSFTLQPLDQNAIAGAQVTFTVQLSGVPAPNIQWQISTSGGGGTWSDLANNETYSGVTTATLQISAATLAMNNDTFRAVASNVVNTATSSPAILQVRETFNSWLQSRFTPEQRQDPNISGWDKSPAGDNLTNLFKYAFDLDPFTSGGGAALPAPTVSNGNLTLEFSAIRSDVFYSVEASTDLVHWSTDGVTLVSEGNLRRATFSLTGRPAAFLRIVVTYNQPTG